jgi:hypothetical protein
MISQIAIDSELAAPPPRVVRHRDGFGAGCGLWAIRLFILPHMIIGLGMLGTALTTTVQYVRVLVVGVECAGHVVQKTAEKGSKGHVYYSVDYAYPVNGVEHRGRVSVDQHVYEGLTEGDPVPVRTLESDPEKNPWPRIGSRSAPMEVLVAWGAALFWNGIMSFGIWFLYVRPYRARRLIRYGEPTVGMIRSWAPQPTKGGMAYKLTYEYPVTDLSGLSGTVQTGTMTTQRKDGADYLPGRPVTVVYDPEKPWRSVIYALGDYRAQAPIGP